MHGSMAVSVAADGVSPVGGETVVDSTAPGGPEVVRTYLLDLVLTRKSDVLATNRHLIAVADPSWDPPPGLSDGVTSYGEDAGDRALRFALHLTGLAPNQPVTLEVPQYGGAVETVATGAADAGGAFTFPVLRPDEYAVRAGGTEAAHVTLTRDTDLHVPLPAT